MFDLLAGAPGLFVAMAMLLGLMVGSFLNVVIYRLPRMMEREWRSQCAELDGQVEDGRDVPSLDAVERFNLMVPRSACPHCGHAIAWHENIPVLSYLWLRGRCNACKATISWSYPLVELSSAVLAGAVAWHFGFGGVAALGLILVWALLVLTGIDLDTYLLPDSITLPLLWLGLLVNLNGMFTSLDSAVIGAVAGYLSLWSVYHLFRLLTGKEGMGYGDFKLLAALGAWFGWAMLPVIILASSLAGAVIGIAMIVLAGHDRAKPIPFGPYLAMGGLIALFWGHELTRFYFG